MQDDFLMKMGINIRDDSSFNKDDLCFKLYCLFVCLFVLLPMNMLS